MAMPNVNEIAEVANRESLYRVVRYLQNQYLRTPGSDNEYSAALELLQDVLNTKF